MTEKLTQLDSPLLAHIHKDATGLYNGITGNKEWATEIRRLAAARDAVILAHNYELPEIQDIADYTGDFPALPQKTHTPPSCSVVCTSWQKPPKSSHQINASSSPTRAPAAR